MLKQIKNERRCHAVQQDFPQRSYKGWGMVGGTNLPKHSVVEISKALFHKKKYEPKRNMGHLRVYWNLSNKIVFSLFSSLFSYTQNKTISKSSLDNRLL